MARIIQAQATGPAGLECDICAHRELDPAGGLERIMKRGSWAQAMFSSEKHICQRCYRELEPLAREGYGRRPLTRSRSTSHPAR